MKKQIVLGCMAAMLIGTVFAQQTQWVQWYEYTGVSGGTLWILVVNIFIFNSIKKYNTQGLKASIGNCFGFIALMGFPFLTGFYSKDLIIEISAFCFNVFEFISTIYCAVESRKGKFVKQFFFGNITNLICRADDK